MKLDSDTLEIIHIMNLADRGSAGDEHRQRFAEIAGMSMADARELSRFEYRFRFTYDSDGLILDVTEDIPHGREALLGDCINEVWGKRWVHDTDYPDRLECLASRGRAPGLDMVAVAGRALAVVRERHATKPRHADIARVLGYDEIADIEDGRAFAHAVAATGDGLLKAAIELETAGTLRSSLGQLAEMVDALQATSSPTP